MTKVHWHQYPGGKFRQVVFFLFSRVARPIQSRVLEQSCRLAHLSVGLPVGELWRTADWVWMPFGMVSGVGRWMGVLDEGGDRRRGTGSLG